MPDADRAPRRTGVAPPLHDVALTAGVATVTGLGAGAMSASLALGDPWWTGALVALEAVPLAWRRRAPLMTLAATLALGWVVAAAPATMAGLLVAALIACYTVASSLHWRVAVAAGLVGAIASPLVVVELLGSPFPFEFSVVPEPLHVANALAGALVGFGGAVALGTSVRVRRLYTASVEAHAARVERERAEREHRAVLEERARIARELHDVAAHHLSGLVLQAGALERTVDRDPDRARALAEEVREGGARALASMRRLVGLLRAADDESAGRGSQPTLADLDHLLDRARNDGLDVTLTARADPATEAGDQTPDEIELAAYRVVQEALSNTRRHAPGARVSVAVRRDDSHLAVEVVDDGGTTPPTVPPSADEGSGQGLIGMRERVGLLGGTLDVGPIQPAGWRVRAEIPVEPKEAA